ncbi:hypothetical protein ACFVUS_22245 [Nocardia sp. NPDC058058]|uniref:hypothetical protein n=1 Tax=Nocardia sp. NPDC058058 TaxID=3346317 RepID=UPI0036DBE37C
MPGAGDETVRQTLSKSGETAADRSKTAESESNSTNAPTQVSRKDTLLAALLFAVDIAIVALFSYDLFGKAFGLVRNRCTAKKDFSVQCTVIRPAGSALWGLLIAGGGMSLALVAALVLAAVAAMTGRRAWWWTAAALPIIAICGLIGHFLVGNAVD